MRHRLCLLGDVEGDVVRLTPAGRMVEAWWHHLPHKFSHLCLDAFVVMPHHIHGIVGIMDTRPTTVSPPTTIPPTVGADPRVRPPSEPGAIPHQGAHVGAPLPTVVQWWKTMTTNAYIRGVRAAGWPPFDGQLWQRNYWERIIRTPRELDLTRRYIAGNPLRWHLDPMNPGRPQNQPE
ncbi:MAG: hypothetical protein ABJF88_16900 [Rhodothermales bacterium]